MKKLLFLFAFLALASCDQHKDRVHYMKVGKDTPQWQVNEQLLRICGPDKPAPCAAVALNHGKSKPAYPLTSIDHIAMINIYDPAFLQNTPAPFKILDNCDTYPEQRQVVERFCLTVEEANNLLKLFYSK